MYTRSKAGSWACWPHSSGLTNDWARKEAAIQSTTVESTKVAPNMLEEASLAVIRLSYAVQCLLLLALA